MARKHLKFLEAANRRSISSTLADSDTGVFVSVAKLLRIAFYKEHLWWLLPEGDRFGY